MSAPRYSVGDFDYWVADRGDEPVVRDILARVATGGKIQVAFQREPDAYGARFGASAEDFILARNRRSGEYVGVCERVVRDCFVNGALRRLPYLAALRVVPGFRHRLLVLRGGFEAVRQLLAGEDELPFSLTSIMSDNAVARRVLSANLRGMPRYEPVGEFSTFALTVQGRATAELATVADLPRISELLLERAARLQFAPAWTLATLRMADTEGWLRAQDFLVLRRDGRIRACAALWDQSAYRQLVVTGYSPWMGRTRPLINVAAKLLGLPPLPAPGGQLRCAYLSHLGMDEAAPADLPALMAAARAEAKRRGIDLVLTGHASGHPLTTALRAMPRQREFRSQLYLVRWPDGAAPQLDPALTVAPELALL